MAPAAFGEQAQPAPVSGESHEDMEKDLASSPGIRRVEKNAFSFIYSASGRGRVWGLSEGQLMFSTNKPCV